MGINETLTLINEETIPNLDGIQMCCPKAQLFHTIMILFNFIPPNAGKKT